MVLLECKKQKQDRDAYDGVQLQSYYFILWGDLVISWVGPCVGTVDKKAAVVPGLTVPRVLGALHPGAVLYGDRIMQVCYRGGGVAWYEIVSTALSAAARGRNLKFRPFCLDGDFLCVELPRPTAVRLSRGSGAEGFLAVCV